MVCPGSLVVDGANVYDIVLAKDTRDKLMARRSARERVKAWHFEADKDYDSSEVRYLATYYSYITHIPHNKRNAKQAQEQKQNQLPTYH